MKKNMGTTDKIIRLLLAAVVGGLYFAGVISGVTATILGIVALVFVLTGLIGFCPLYLPFGISTMKHNQDK